MWGEKMTGKIVENEYENKYYCPICKKDHKRNSEIGEKHYLLLSK